MIRRHFIKSGPGTLGIDGKILKDRHTISGVHQDLFDERRFEVGLVARRFLGIVPCQQKAAAFRTEMKARAHVDDHGRGMGKVGKRFGRHQHAAKRLNRQIDANELRNLRSPCPGGVDNCAG